MSTKTASPKAKKAPKKVDQTKRIGPYREAWRRLRQSKVAMAMLGIVALLAFMAIFADLFFDYQSQAFSQDIANRFAPFSFEQWLGTDQYGRDLFVRIIYGFRTAFQMGGLGSIFTMLPSIPLAVIAAYNGGRIDNIIMRACDVLNCIPGMVLTIAISAGLGGGLYQLIIALAIGGIAPSIRMIRSKSLAVANAGYIESAKALGASPRRILVKCMIPNVMDIIIIGATGRVAQCIMMGTTLSFVGLGVQSPTPEWGLMLNENVSRMQLYPSQVIVPAAAIVITTVAIATLGDYLRDAFDPRLKGKA